MLIQGIKWLIFSFLLNHPINFISLWSANTNTHYYTHPLVSGFDNLHLSNIDLYCLDWFVSGIPSPQGIIFWTYISHWDGLRTIVEKCDWCDCNCDHYANVEWQQKNNTYTECGVQQKCDCNCRKMQLQLRLGPQFKTMGVFLRTIVHSYGVLLSNTLCMYYFTYWMKSTEPGFGILPWARIVANDGNFARNANGGSNICNNLYVYQGKGRT